MRRISVLIILASLLMTFGCKTQAEAEKTDAKPTSQGESSAADGRAIEEPKLDSAAALQKTLLGTVEKKPWSKSTESWDAGGSEYYVIKVDGGDESHILRSSDAVAFEAFAAYDGKHVEVVGVFVEAKPYVPQDPSEQYPTGFDGKPLPRGSGFQVMEITEK